MAATASTKNLRWLFFAVLAGIGLLRIIDGVRDGAPHHLAFGIGMLLMAFFATQHDPLDRNHPGLAAMTRLQKIAFVGGVIGIALCLGAVAWRFTA